MVLFCTYYVRFNPTLISPLLHKQAQYIIVLALYFVYVQSSAFDCLKNFKKTKKNIWLMLFNQFTTLNCNNNEVKLREGDCYKPFAHIILYKIDKRHRRHN